MTEASVPADRVITIAMELQHWNMVVQLLGKAPYEVVQPYIDMIRMQATQQLTPAPVPLGAPLGNGVDYGSNYKQGEAGTPEGGFRSAGEGDGTKGEGTGKLPD